MAKGRTFLVYWNGVLYGKKIVLSVGSYMLKYVCDDGTVFLLNLGVKIGILINKECYLDTIKFLMVIMI